MPVSTITRKTPIFTPPSLCNSSPGGHNVTISLQSRTGHTHMPSVVGVLVFTQFWFWFPLSHFLSLAFTPTCVIGLNKDLKMPKVQYRSNVKPSTFAYPAPLEVPKEKEKEKEEAEKKDEKEKKKEPEPSFQILDNPARVMPAQLKVLTMPESCRYQPFKTVSFHYLPACLPVSQFRQLYSKVINDADHGSLERLAQGILDA
ncbi:putative 26S proteasome non-ATPase regulatory subunit 1 protein, partial [Naja naja]